MEEDVLIAVEQVSKKYCKSLKRSMVYGILDICRNILGLSSRPGRLRKNEFWAVKDLSVKVKRGEALGLIGPNGSGKSTTLKMLNGIFWPDKGKISVRGRVGALIEVGAGFHPMLTGRENVYINGAILGMSKKEIAQKFDSIVAFADIGAFIDTPVKNYSSGMFVRLGFAIAVHCEPDVLLVDEILAVGDLSFQVKCREKIREMRRTGVTILLVSQNMHTISHICEKTIFLNYGEPVFCGETSRAIDIYREYQENHIKKGITAAGERDVKISGFEILDAENKEKSDFNTGDYIKFRVFYDANIEISNPVVSMAIYNEKGDVVSEIRNDVDRVEFGNITGKGFIELEINELNLLPEIYTINVTLIAPDGFTFYDRIERVAKIKVLGGKKVNGNAYFPHKWQFPQ